MIIITEIYQKILIFLVKYLNNVKYNNIVDI